MQRSPRWFGLLAALILLPFFHRALHAAEKVPADEPLTFEKHIRPLLKVHCVHCHGEADDRQGELDVRLRRLLVKGGESGPAIEPGKAAESLLVERLRAGEMPPGDKKLPAGEIALIERWINQGAKTARPEPEQLSDESLFTEEERSFWSFQPIRTPAVPAVKSDRARTPVDAFILDKLAEKKLALSPEADRRTLIRRATFDLLGLPPSPAEVNEFLADQSPDAYEKLIDRLLARPEYGERWGRHWLDIAGYADSDGYTPQDTIRPYAYKYRDYVIRAFNSDKPFNEFIQEQLAGDELAGPKQGEWRPEQIEKLSATGFLRMAADGTGVVPAAEQDVARNAVMGDTLKIVSTSLMGLSLGCAECHDHKYDPILQADYYRVRAIFEPALDWKKWLVPQGRLVPLTTAAEKAEAAKLEAEAAAVDKARAEVAQKFIDKTFEEELAKLPENLREPLRAAFKTPADKRTPAQKKLLQENPSVNVSTGSLYLYDRPRQVALRALEQKKTQRVKELGKTPDEKGKEELAELDRQIEAAKAEISVDVLGKLTEKATAIRAKKPKTDFIHALAETQGNLPETRVFYRGDLTQPKQVVAPGEPLILASYKPNAIPPKNTKLPTSGRRLALAQRLTDGEHPLVARVLVNRFWMHHFGRGIVGSPSDFGVLGERPTHLELLDWLARDFIDNGWKLKRIHKLIMTSTVYRQTSQHAPASDAVDPDNRYLSRMNVRRLEAEALRDSILAASGKLNPKQFGPPVPVMPDEVGQIVIGIDTRDTAGRPSGKVIAIGDDLYRRSVYVQVRRSMPLGMLETFDAPTMTSNCNCESRDTSTVAPQSLVLMNSDFLIEQAEFMAARVAAEASADDLGRVKHAWLLAFAREPDERETTGALAFLARQRTELEAAAKSAKPADKNAPKIDPGVRALANLCQALVSSNEFLYVD